MRRAGLALLSLFVAGCGFAAKPCEPRRSDPSGFTLSDGEFQLESTLHQVDLLDAKIRDFKSAPGDPISTCMNKDRDVLAHKLAFKLLLGKPQAQDKAAEISYYDLLAEGSPPELIPVVHLRRSHQEGLLKCLINSSPGRHEATEESKISILTSLDFDAQTGNGLFVVDFMAHWCLPCKAMVPSLEKLAQEYEGKLRVGRLNVDRNRSISERFNIKEFPTLMILKDGDEISRLNKSTSYPDLREWAQEVLKRETASSERDQE